MRPPPFWSPLWQGTEDDAELLEILIAAGCPICCVGHRDPDGEDWHAECEERGRRAFAILRPMLTPSVVERGE